MTATLPPIAYFDGSTTNLNAYSYTDLVIDAGPENPSELAAWRAYYNTSAPVMIRLANAAEAFERDAAALKAGRQTKLRYSRP
jgi:hypothetical protein